VQHADIITAADSILQPTLVLTSAAGAQTLPALRSTASADTASARRLATADTLTVDDLILCDDTAVAYDVGRAPAPTAADYTLPAPMHGQPSSVAGARTATGYPLLAPMHAGAQGLMPDRQYSLMSTVADTFKLSLATQPAYTSAMRTHLVSTQSASTQLHGVCVPPVQLSANTGSPSAPSIPTTLPLYTSVYTDMYDLGNLGQPALPRLLTVGQATNSSVYPALLSIPHLPVRTM